MRIEKLEVVVHAFIISSLSNHGALDRALRITKELLREYGFN